jgi:hypothetical protein
VSFVNPIPIFARRALLALSLKFHRLIGLGLEMINYLTPNEFENLHLTETQTTLA